MMDDHTPKVEHPTNVVVEETPKRVNFEKIEFQFHQYKRERNIEGLKQMAEEYPEVYGIAVEEFLRNVVAKQQVAA